jgi:nucleotide-binding universal stress UspA family protein
MVREFDRARLQADWEQVLARLTGKPVDLIAYEEVRQKLNTQITPHRTLKDIPIDAIVGSVGRAADFTRKFYPLRDNDATRWERVREVTEKEGALPIEVYQIGEAYFVADGNHRVSVARQMGAQFIEAMVTEVSSPVSLKPDARPEDIILQARRLEFLQRTHLDKLRPDAELRASEPAAYDMLARHIELHRYVMSTTQKRDVAEIEAATDWYDNIYSVIANVIREHNVLRDFPNHTEADVYLMVSGYRALMDEATEWESQSSAEPTQVKSFVARVLGRIQNVLASDDASERVMPGSWRREHVLANLQNDDGQVFRLFKNILVPLNGRASGWDALTVALDVAQRERGRVLGLYVTQDDAGAVQAEFARRCEQASIFGSLAIESGDIAETISNRAEWVDITVIKIAHPPPALPFAKLGSGMRTLIRNCASPILFTPGIVYHFGRAVLGYDASSKSNEALAVAAYLARRWNMALTVVSVPDNKHDAGEALYQAQDFLRERKIQATLVNRPGSSADVLLRVAHEQRARLIIVGGYGHNPLVELTLGSTVDEILRTSYFPTLVCP